MKKPKWCTHKDCKFKVQSQDMMCVGELPKLISHNGGFNTHRICLDTRETGHGIFDLMVNWTDCWGMIRLLKTVKPKCKASSLVNAYNDKCKTVSI